MVIPHRITANIANGQTTGSGESGGPVSGWLMAIHIDYSNIAAATCDVTIATKAAPIETLFVRSDSVTDGWFYPRYQCHDSTGAAIAGVYGPALLDDYITVAVAQADEGSVVVTLKVDQSR